jgi:hypothetical protein
MSHGYEAPGPLQTARLNRATRKKRKARELAPAFAASTLHSGIAV